MNKVIATFAIATLAFSTACSNKDELAAKELNAFCREVEALNTTNDEPLMKSHKLASFLTANMTHEGLKKGFLALAGVDPSQKYEILKRLAEQEGVPGWTCPAFEVYQSK
ncbi:MAG TPA: hypothetical protein VM901_13150 [Bdellovibrionota bacterium]|jgi:hypothetical protein|nr:hypothetical protein [Bdellovibrionota bacterium]